MRVAIIGLGDIAQKAYLPVLASLPGIELHLHTRTARTLRRVADSWHIPAARTHRTMADLLDAAPDAALVHAATSAHPGLARQLIDAGIPTYVDKPLAYDLAEARRLTEHAAARSTALMVGFNRRYAESYAQCRTLPRELIVLQKHRTGLPDDIRRVVFDDFIHVVDTLRFLAPEKITDRVVRGVSESGRLHQVVLQLSGAGFTAIGAMNRRSGSSEEILEVSGQDHKREVRHLAEVTDHQGHPTVRRRGDWVPVARQRGIEGAVTAFLTAVRSGDPLTAEAQDALRTHELCEQIVTDLTSAGR